MELPFATADVFTDRPFGGNPLAVFPDARGLDAPVMQAIAGEFNLSETTFVTPADGPGHRRRVRIFTPAMELPFAGHPTIGTAILLAEAGAFGEFGASADIVLEQAAGPVPVRLERMPDGAIRAMLTSPRLPSPAGDIPDRAVLAGILGLPAESLAADAPPAAYGAGVPFTIVPVRSRADLASIRVDTQAWRAHLAEGPAPHLYAVALEDWDDGREVHARMFAPAMGISEDPATGAAVAALAGYLADRQRPGDGSRTWTIRQGETMGRPSTITLSAETVAGRPTAVRVGGTAVAMSRGVFLLPSRGGAATRP